MINSRKVRGRRKLRFNSFDEIFSDVERFLAAEDVKMLGNWPLGRLLGHLAQTIDSSIDGISTRAPWLVRRLAPLIKRRLLSHGFSPGYKLPAHRQLVLFPDVACAGDGGLLLRRAAARMQRERMTAAHPAFGTLTHEEWFQFHLRHAELHLSYAVQVSNA
jgi:hypothetical protein